MHVPFIGFSINALNILKQGAFSFSHCWRCCPGAQRFRTNVLMWDIDKIWQGCTRSAAPSSSEPKKAATAASMGGKCFKTASSGTFADDLSDMSITEKGHTLEIYFSRRATITLLQHSSQNTQKLSGRNLRKWMKMARYCSWTDVEVNISQRLRLNSHTLAKLPLPKCRTASPMSSHDVPRGNTTA